MIYIRFFSGKNHPKSTKENPIVDFDTCVQSVKTVVLPLVNPKPVTLNQHQIAAFSYFFERMIENGLIGEYCAICAMLYPAIRSTFYFH